MGKRNDVSMVAAAMLACGGWAAVMAAQISSSDVPEAVTPPAGHRDGAAVNTKTTVNYPADYVFYKP